MWYIYLHWLNFIVFRSKSQNNICPSISSFFPRYHFGATNMKQTTTHQLLGFLLGQLVKDKGDQLACNIDVHLLEVTKDPYSSKAINLGAMKLYILKKQLNRINKKNVYIYIYYIYVFFR